MKLWRAAATVMFLGFVVAPSAWAVSAVNADCIRGLTVWTPANGVDDYRTLTYLPGAEEWGLTRADFQAGEGYRQNIQNATGAPMVRAWTPSGSLTAPWIAPRAGMLTGVSVCAEANVGAGSYTVTVHKNGTATAISAQVSSKTYKARMTATPAQFVSFAAGDEIILQDAKAGSVSNTGAVAQWFAVWTE